MKIQVSSVSKPVAPSANVGNGFYPVPHTHSGGSGGSGGSASAAPRDGSARTADLSGNSLDPVSWKRKRVSKACNNCRKKRSKCDGADPACSGCIKRGLADSCEYPKTSKKRGTPLGYSQSLEVRILVYQAIFALAMSRDAGAAAQISRAVADLAQNGGLSLITGCNSQWLSSETCRDIGSLLSNNYDVLTELNKGLKAAADGSADVPRFSELLLNSEHPGDATVDRKPSVSSFALSSAVSGSSGELELPFESSPSPDSASPALSTFSAFSTTPVPCAPPAPPARPAPPAAAPPMPRRLPDATMQRSASETAVRAPAADPPPLTISPAAFAPRIPLPALRRLDLPPLHATKPVNAVKSTCPEVPTSRIPKGRLRTNQLAGRLHLGQLWNYPLIFSLREPEGFPFAACATCATANAVSVADVFAFPPDASAILAAYFSGATHSVFPLIEAEPLTALLRHPPNPAATAGKPFGTMATLWTIILLHSQKSHFPQASRLHLLVKKCLELEYFSNQSSVQPGETTQYQFTLSAIQAMVLLAVSYYNGGEWGLAWSLVQFLYSVASSLLVMSNQSVSFSAGVANGGGGYNSAANSTANPATNPATSATSATSSSSSVHGSIRRTLGCIFVLKTILSARFGKLIKPNEKLLEEYFEGYAALLEFNPVLTGMPAGGPLDLQLVFSNLVNVCFHLDGLLAGTAGDTPRLSLPAVAADSPAEAVVGFHRSFLAKIRYLMAELPKWSDGSFQKQPCDVAEATEVSDNGPDSLLFLYLTIYATQVLLCEKTERSLQAISTDQPGLSATLNVAELLPELDATFAEAVSGMKQVLAILMRKAVVMPFFDYFLVLAYQFDHVADRKRILTGNPQFPDDFESGFPRDRLMYMLDSASFYKPCRIIRDIYNSFKGE